MKKLIFLMFLFISEYSFAQDTTRWDLHLDVKLDEISDFQNLKLYDKNDSVRIEIFFKDRLVASLPKQMISRISSGCCDVIKMEKIKSDPTEKTIIVVKLIIKEDR